MVTAWHFNHPQFLQGSHSTQACCLFFHTLPVLLTEQCGLCDFKDIIQSKGDYLLHVSRGALSATDSPPIKTNYISMYRVKPKIFGHPFNDSLFNRIISHCKKSSQCHGWGRPGYFLPFVFFSNEMLKFRWSGGSACGRLPCFICLTDFLSLDSNSGFLSGSLRSLASISSMTIPET